jgi:hypothetical protein
LDEYEINDSELKTSLLSKMSVLKSDLLKPKIIIVHKIFIQNDDFDQNQCIASIITIHYQSNDIDLKYIRIF